MPIPVLSDEQRAKVEERIDRSDLDGCWLWTGTITSRGYGQIHLNYRSLRAHVLVYELLVGPVPADRILCHTCDVRLCVRPDHLYVGTHAQNQADKARRGRSLRGVDNPGGGKLTPEDVRAIRSALTTGRGFADIGREFGVSRTEIRFIHLGQHWSHVT